MKRVSKILSLLLIAMVLLVIAPASAHAAFPPDTTHRHDWDMISDKPATCTEMGVRTWRCSLCRMIYTEYFYALGHDWDEGVITTEPGLFTPGIKTFTCKRDPSHTYTEEVASIFAVAEAPDVTEAVFEYLRGNQSVNPVDIPPIVITEQPQGGSITRWEDETHNMHVTASGGVGEFTYEWHTASQDVGKDEKYNDLLKWLVGLLGVTPEQVEQALEASYSDTDTCTVSLAGQEYYCIVHDEAGQSATSDKALVRYKIRIAKQPDNVNLQLPNHDFYCAAADGSGDYTYRWYDHDEGILGEGQSYPAEKEGYYYCIVTDNVTGETATSEYCEVYSAEPFHLVNITKDCEVLPKDDAFVIASFAGGVGDYEIWWDKDGTAIDSVEGRDELDNVYSRANVDGEGVYTVHGVDSLYATASGSVTITVPQLTILEQPQGGNLPYKGGGLPLSIQVTGGKEPYHYELFRNGVSYVNGTSSPLTAWKSGSYYFRVEDSEGRYCKSHSVYVGDAVLRIVAQSHTEDLPWPGASLALYVEAAGGKLPYTYHWSVKKGSDWYDTGSDSQWQMVYAPGEYYCQVVDADNDFVFTDTMTVTYTGEAPWIIVQPQNTEVPNVPEGQFFTTLTCRAISATGDDSNLKYLWEVQYPTEGSWALLQDQGSDLKVEYTGAYRCRVVDTVTGKYTYSQAAYVYWPLTCGLAQPWKSSNSLMYFYRCSFRGGVGPYTVYAYRVVTDPTCRLQGEWFLRDGYKGVQTINTMSELFLIPILMPKYIEVLDLDASPQVYKQYKAGCAMVVADALGNRCESPVMEWK